MSTRANVIIQSKKNDERIILYRHLDGYPDGTLPTLNIFMEWLKEGCIRADVSQGGTWLILIGAYEYGTFAIPETERGKNPDLEKMYPPTDWKAGAYEMTSCIHEDIEYLYTIDMDTKELTWKQVEYGEAAKLWKEGKL